MALFPIMMVEAGGEGVIEFHPPTMSLVVKNTENVHAQIEDLLNTLRKVKIMVND